MVITLGPLLNPELSKYRFPLKKAGVKRREKIQQFLPEDPQKVCVFYDWSEEGHKEFYELCQSPSMPHPNRWGDFKEWLVLSFRC